MEACMIDAPGLTDVKIDEQPGVVELSGVIDEGPKAGKVIRYGVYADNFDAALSVISKWIIADAARQFCRERNV